MLDSGVLARVDLFRTNFPISHYALPLCSSERCTGMIPKRFCPPKETAKAVPERVKRVPKKGHLYTDNMACFLRICIFLNPYMLQSKMRIIPLRQIMVAKEGGHLYQNVDVISQKIKNIGCSEL